jgi:hypothetical protein
MLTGRSAGAAMSASLVTGQARQTQAWRQRRRPLAARSLAGPRQPAGGRHSLYLRRAGAVDPSRSAHLRSALVLRWRGFFRLTGRKRCGPGDRSGCERQISKTANQAAEREDSHDWNDRLSGRRNHQRRRSRLCTIVEIDPAHGSDSSHGLRQRYGARKPSARAFGIYFGQQLTREIAAWRSGRAVFAMKFA